MKVPWWIWLIIAAAVVVVVVIVVLVIKSRKAAASTPGLDDIERGFSRFNAHVKEQEAALDSKIAESKAKLDELNGQAAKIAADRRSDHEKIKSAADWDDLDSMAEDIERRR